MKESILFHRKSGATLFSNILRKHTSGIAQNHKHTSTLDIIIKVGKYHLTYEIFENLLMYLNIVFDEVKIYLLSIAWGFHLGADLGQHALEK